MAYEKSSYHKKWWVKTIRERNFFGFRYWWFNWVVWTLAGFLLIYGIFLQNSQNQTTCLHRNNLSRPINRILEQMEKCCSCTEDETSNNGLDSIAVECPDRVLVFQICNSNKAKDDNFFAYLNGRKIGEIELNSNDLVGSVFLASTDNSIKIKDADFVCHINKVKHYYFDPKLVNFGLNTIYLKNVKNNNNSNEGTIELRNYRLTGNHLSEPCVVKNLNYNGRSGEDFTITFEYTRCCE